MLFGFQMASYSQILSVVWSSFLIECTDLNRNFIIIQIKTWHFLAMKTFPIETKDKQALAYVNRKVSAWKELDHVVTKAEEQSYRRKMTTMWYLNKRNS